MFRRAAINAALALGSARSFYANLDRWRKPKEKAEAKGKKFKEGLFLPMEKSRGIQRPTFDESQT